MHGHDAEHESETSSNPELDLLLGVHRLAGVLMGDVALRTELDGVRMRIGDPLTLKRYSPGTRVPFPEMNGGRERMRKILERAFADRVQVIPAGARQGREPATHMLEATISMAREGVLLEFRLLSLGERTVVGTARGLVKGADLSLLTRKEYPEKDIYKPGNSEGTLWIMPSGLSSQGASLGASSPTQVALTEVSAAPPNRRETVQPPSEAPEHTPSRDPANSGSDTPPSSAGPSPSAPAKDLPNWINDILSRYTGPPKPGPE